MTEGSYSMYFITESEVTRGKHQLDMLPNFVGGVDTYRLKRDWKVQCNQRTHGFHGAEFVCWCFNPNADNCDQQLSPNICENCTVRDWKDV